jgi:hypothetical protein
METRSYKIPVNINKTLITKEITQVYFEYFKKIL